MAAVDVCRDFLLANDDNDDVIVGADGGGGGGESGESAIFWSLFWLAADVDVELDERFNDDLMMISFAMIKG